MPGPDGPSGPGGFPPHRPRPVRAPLTSARPLPPSGHVTAPRTTSQLMERGARGEKEERK